jgi:hypothetical protein
MSKNKDDETTAISEPTIEEILDAMTARFLDEVNAEGKRHARDIKTTWHGIPSTDRLGFARQVRTMVQTGLRKPVPGADLR